ncbi:MAG: PRC-barrel domain-containing protein [Thermoleophilaceae bacterium]
MDYGAPISYLVLSSGADVISSDGERLGVVKRVLADKPANIFDGILIDVRTGPGGLRFVDAPEVAEIYERAVVLTLTAEEAQALRKHRS